MFDYPNTYNTVGAFTKVYYYGYDAVGNVVFVSEEGATESEKAYLFQQDAFGNELSAGAFDSDDWDTARDDRITEHQTGKELDAFAGLYYFAHRWYDADTGRFTSLDPARDDWNRYLFSRNSPTAVADPQGLRNYRLGTADPTITFDAGSGQWRKDSPTEDDRDSHKDWGRIASIARRIFRLDDAASHMEHYLGNSGNTYVIDLEGMLAEVDAAENLLHREMDWALEFAETLPLGEHSITSGNASGGRNAKREKWNWFYAVGDYWAWGKGTVCALSNDEFTMEFKYTFADKYNWDPGKVVRILGHTVSDTTLGRLHQVGLAKEFEMTGSIVYELEWKRGERVGSGVSIDPGDDDRR